MRFTSPSTAIAMRRRSMGPAAIADTFSANAINRGLAQRPFINADSMRRGGSMGMQSQSTQALGCLCGPGDPGFLGATAPANVVLGPVAKRIIAMRKSGSTPQAALLDAMQTLDAQGVKTITQDIHAQLAIALQPNIPAGLGSLGLAPVIGAGVGAASLASTSAAITGVTAAGLAAALGLGQTIIPIPVVGAVIGVIIFVALHALQRHVGKAEAAWKSPQFIPSLYTTAGREYSDKTFSEAFKGMMDTNGNIFLGCGADRHKDPDCMLAPLAPVIAAGYMSGKVPLTATTAQVYNTVVVPWLQSGAGGLINWSILGTAGRRPGQLMFQAATDKYLADQAITRGDMPDYANQSTGVKTPPLIQLLQPMISQQTAYTSTPQIPGAPAQSYVQPVAANPGVTYVQPTATGPAPPALDTSGGSTVGLQPPTYAVPIPGAPAAPVYSGGGAAVGYGPSPSLPAPVQSSIPGSSGGIGIGTIVGLGVAALSFFN